MVSLSAAAARRCIAVRGNGNAVQRFKLSSRGSQITLPGRISPLFLPKGSLAHPQPAVTGNVWPKESACHAVLARPVPT